MRLILTHKLPQSYDADHITVEGDDYAALYKEALILVPEGRIASGVRVERPE